MSFTFTPPTPRRRPSLTPMIDVVFLLLVFFMLAARFGIEGTITLGLSGGSAPYEGPPRLVDIYPAEVRLNGVPLDSETLLASLAELTRSPEDIIILRIRDGADTQRLVDIMLHLKDAGYAALTLSE